nr:AraC family transcriptional regulator [Sphingomonas sp. CDS-1]
MPQSEKILPFPTIHGRPLPSSPEGSAIPAEGRRRVPPKLLEGVLAHVEASGGGEGLFPLPVDGVHVIRAKRRVPANPQLYKPSLCIVISGRKQIDFGVQSLEYGEMECLIVNLEIPASGRILGANPDEPFLGITIDLDIDQLRSVLEQLPEPLKPSRRDNPGVFVAQVSDEVADCLTRMMRLAQMPDAVPVLYPAIMREIYYWLLTGPHGADLCKHIVPETHLQRVANAIRLMRENFSRTIRVEQLAEAARMSPSTFHQHFKALTMMTPVQFQKRLRLLAARRLMVTDSVNVTEAAYQVGYESASQFSREYSRVFGIAPKRDVMNLKALMAEVRGV